MRPLAALPGWPVGETFVEVRPEEAHDAGLQDGARVRVVTAEGSVPAVLKTTEGLAPGVAALAVGFDTSAVRVFNAAAYRSGCGLSARARIEAV